MTPLGFHLTCRLLNGQVIAPTPIERRILARVVFERSAGHRLLSFSAADTHLHMQLLEPEAKSLELARRIELSLHYRLKLPVGFTGAYPEPILKQQHLANCFDYIMAQQPHHGLAWDPYREASNLPDLLGLRLIGARTIGNVRAYLPRVNRVQLLGHFGLSELKEADGPLDQVVPAALAASALNDLSRRGPEQSQARRAILEVARGRIQFVRLAREIGVSARTLRRACELPLNRPMAKAIRLQLSLRRVKTDPATAFVG